jgi:uncharacterized membrane protein
MKNRLKNITLTQAMPFIILIAGGVALLASFVLTRDTFHLMDHPNTRVGCDLNPIVSCGTVIKSKSSEILFGVPNPVYGLGIFSALFTMGVLLVSGVKFPRWIWLGLQAGVTGGVILVHWFFYHSVFVIGALCPYCMLTWSMVIPLFWYVTLYNIREKNIILPARSRKLVNFAHKHHFDAILLWLVIITVIILNNFWYYFGKHLPF